MTGLLLSFGDAQHKPGGRLSAGWRCNGFWVRFIVKYPNNLRTLRLPYQSASLPGRAGARPAPSA